MFGPLYDWPLAVLDYTSIDCARDLIASDNVYPHQVSETYNVFFNKSHRWFYLSGHQPHELLLFKAYDSRTKSGTARGTRFRALRNRKSFANDLVCPHAAFYDPSAPPNSRRRESVECISLVLYPKGAREEEYEEVCGFFLTHLSDVLKILRCYLRKRRVLLRRKERSVFNLSSVESLYLR